MLLHTHVLPLSDGCIRLPPWVRAPLGLPKSGGAWVACNPRGGVGCELVISAWESRCWGDIWRIELDFTDQPGIMKDLIALLDESNIDLLVSETGVVGLSNAVALICDCSEYKSPVDDNSHSRRIRDDAELRGLSALITIAMIERFRFWRGEGPRMRIRRLNAYRRLRNNLDSEVGYVLLDGEELSLPSGILGQAREKIRVSADAPLVYTLTADTKDRLIRVLVLPAKAAQGTARVAGSPTTWPPLDAKILINKRARVLGQAFAAIHAAGLNIIKSHLRHGVVDPRGVLKGRQDMFSTLDVTLVSESPDTPEGILGRLTLELSRLPAVIDGDLLLDARAAGDFLAALDQLIGGRR